MTKPKVPALVEGFFLGGGDPETQGQTKNPIPCQLGVIKCTMQAVYQVQSYKTCITHCPFRSLGICFYSPGI